MILRFFVFVFFILIGSFLEGAYACAPVYPNIFHRPHYIDPEFHQNANSAAEEAYNKNTEFRFVLQSFPQETRTSADKNDSKARKWSQRKQPEQYAEYEKAVEKFNRANYEDTLTIFSALKQSSSGWAREASTYMIARTHKNIAEKNWDGMWIDLTNNKSARAKMIDQVELQKAERSYEIYLEEYPHGLYADSARNIKRHFLLLSGKQAEYNQAITQAILKQGRQINQNLFDEYSNHYEGDFSIEKDTPPLLVAYHLIHRNSVDHSYLTILESRKQDFINYPGLFPFLRALILYKLKEYQMLLTQMPEKPLMNTPLSISLEYLHYRAAFHLNRNKEALDSLLRMYALMPNDSSLEHHLALLQIKTNQALWLFSKKGPIQDKAKLALFAQYGLSDTDLLRGLVLQDIPHSHHRILAEELAQRYLLNREYAKLITLLKQYPEIKAYDSIRPDIFALTNNKSEASALLQVGNFIYKHYFFPGAMDIQDPFYGPNDRLNELFGPEERLKKIFLERVKNYAPPLWYYKKALRLIQATSRSSPIEARALSYLVQCPHYLERRLRCSWNEEIDYDSKFYFDLLHKKYKDSEWAKKTPYWYQA